MIPIGNIYYMLAYAFRALRQSNFSSLASEDFENSIELCAAILTKGVESQIKRGLGRTYIEETKTLSTIRGRIEIGESLRRQSIHSRKLVCTHDEFSVNSNANRIIKSTIQALLGRDVSPERKRALRRLLPYFGEVNETSLKHIDWNTRFDRNNQTYQMLLFVCRLIVEGLIQSSAKGSGRLAEFVDDQAMSKLYERFIFEYYRQEHPEINVSSPQIPWALDDENAEMLPIMQSDIVLSDEQNILVIDAKYYSQMTQQNYGSRTIHSDNLYQIFTYVKNKQLSIDDEMHRVSGMLLYAKTDEAIVPNTRYSMSGNTVSVRALDLTGDFASIKAQLDSIASKSLYAGSKND